MPILQKYNFKATAFIIGKLTYNNEKGIIKYSRIPKLKNYIQNLTLKVILSICMFI